MKTVIISSQNPVKINATKNCFTDVFPSQDFEFIAASVDSQVSDQPMEDETKQGCINRTNALQQEFPYADFYVSIEGGTEVSGSSVWCTAWCQVSTCERTGFGKASTFELPPEISRLILEEGLELGDAGDRVFSTNNIKQGKGTIGIFTNDLITRTDYYREPLILACISHLHPDLY